MINEITYTTLTRADTRLACVEFGGRGVSALLLHGLAGHALEWTGTAAHLVPRYRVLALDLRGHGCSERHPEDVSQHAHVADVAFVIEQLALGPVVLVGHSLGGVTALLVAAVHPELVRALVIADASPGRRAATRRCGCEAQTRAFAPVPAKPWIADDRRRPRYDLEVMVRTLRDANRRDYWDAWERICCPTLVVRASNGMIPSSHLHAMRERLPSVRLVELDDVPHNLHLERPEPVARRADRVLLNATDPRTPPAASETRGRPPPAD